MQREEWKQAAKEYKQTDQWQQEREMKRERQILQRAAEGPRLQSKKKAEKGPAVAEKKRGPDIERAERAVLRVRSRTHFTAVRFRKSEVQSSSDWSTLQNNANSGILTNQSGICLLTSEI